tara:strand:+ start:565 stop:825 length:261 start_codon:yes stop_codon:yes gene_type:complete
VRIKNRWEKPSDGGWRDCMINYVVKTDQKRHVCELQVAHDKMLNCREGMHAHGIYNHTRNATELADLQAEVEKLPSELSAIKSKWM